ncbi:MAG: hypothetical protein J6C19_14415 [Lachnospiraceae bacterium]|nr:hypothetical protein [Lachnospiraceae bacterium]MBO5146696.1 hypothetical protein [Lachnospiraceae bacterium]
MDTDTFELQRKALEQLYTGRCTVYEYKNVTNEVTKITTKKEAEVLSDIPCRLSHSNIQTTNDNTGAAERSISTKLFLSPEIQIRPGSKIAVMQNNQLKFYASSGEPAVYPTHQEIMLTLFERWT